MSALLFESLEGRARIGMKGPRAEEWLAGRGIVLPAAPNTWSMPPSVGSSGGLLVARLGTSEFFLEDAADAVSLREIGRGLEEYPPGVYPVLREDAAFQLSGDGVHEVLVQVCNVNFAGLALDSRPVIMTLMLGVAVLVVPQEADTAGRDAARRYRIWCDPTFGPFLGEAVGGVVVDCGGTLRGLTASPSH
jgi:sarcosine oxidase, subunit gamma